VLQSINVGRPEVHGGQAPASPRRSWIWGGRWPKPTTLGLPRRDSEQALPIVQATGAESGKESSDGALQGFGGGAALRGMAEIKAGIHRKLLERLNLANLDAVGRDEAIATIREVIQDLLTPQRSRWP
jgi:hypothetical protein